MNDTLKAALKGAAIGLPVSIVASLLAQHGVNTDVLKKSQPGELKINLPKSGIAPLGISPLGPAPLALDTDVLKNPNLGELKINMPKFGSAPLALDTEVLKLPHLGELKINVPKFGIAALGTAAGAALGAGAQQAKFVKDAVIEKSINKNRLLNAQRQVLRENGLLQNVEKPIMAGKKDYDYVVNPNPRPYQQRPYQQRPYQPAQNRNEMLKIDTVKDVTPNYPVVTEPEKNRQFSIVGGGLKLISAGVSGLGNLVGIADAAGKGAKVVQKVGQALSNNVSDSINIKNPILNSVANGVGTTIKYQLVKPAVTKASSNPLLRRQSSGFSETIVPNSMLSDLDSTQIACISNDANLEDSVGARKDLINDRLDSLLTPATLKLNQATTLQCFSEGDFNLMASTIKAIGKSIDKGSDFVNDYKLAIGTGALGATAGLITGAIIKSLEIQKAKEKELKGSAEIANAAGFSEGDFNFITDIGKSIVKGVKKVGVGLGIGRDKFGQDIKNSVQSGLDKASTSVSDSLTKLGKEARETHNKVLESSLKSATPGSDAAKAIETKISDNISNRNVFEKTADIAKVGSEIAKSAVGSIPNKTATQVAVGASKMMNNRLKESKANADEATARAKNAQAGVG